jgi:MFS family permease
MSRLFLSSKVRMETPGQGVIGMAAQLVGGAVADRSFRSSRGDLRGHAWLPAGIALLCTPFAVACYHTRSASLSLMLFCAPTLAANSFDAPTSALLLGMTPPEMRGMTYSVFHMFVGLLAGLGPWLVGVLSDAFSHHHGGSSSSRDGGSPDGSASSLMSDGGAAADVGGLRGALIVLQLVNVLAAVHFCCAARSLGGTSMPRTQALE